VYDLHVITALDKMDNIPEMGDEADAPIIVPPPGQILRRAARTKIRKPGLPGDGGGHRFGSTRRGASARAATIEPRTSSDKSSSDHGDSTESVTIPQRRRTFSDEGPAQRPDSFNEEAIFDAYARDDDEEIPAPVITYSKDDEEIPAPVITSSPPSLIVDLPVPPQPHPEIQPALLEALGPIILQPQPQRLVSPQHPAEHQAPPSSPPEASQSTPSATLTKSPSPPSFLSTTPSPPTHHRKDKDKKGLFGKWGSDKGGKKNGKEKERVAEKEKDSGFFGSLFGGSSKKKQDQDYPSPVHGGIAGREAAQALLGASKSKAYAPSVSPVPSNGPNSYARYPIHVERAIYRLSHIKLANPRRPLYEQVLISNLMFWYLGVINKAQSPASPNGQATAGPQTAVEGQRNDQPEKEQREADLAEQRERAERERQERERLEKEQREIETRKKESGRRGSLTKASVPGSPGNGRRAEMPVKGPQYEMQHRVMEQEYSGHGQGMPVGRSTSTPTSGNGQQYPRIQQQAQFQQGDNFYYSADPGHHIQQPQPRMPPGAMAPADLPARHQSPPPPPRQHSSPLPPPGPGPRRSRSPPPQAHSKQLIKTGRYSPSSSQENLVLGGGVSRIPGRSLSATAGLPPQANGKLRKGSSAHSAIPSDRRPQSVDGRQGQNGTGEEEDMPLAMWQQQHRR
jgi:Activator of mitotic machinery Cdc14 phosphatase activation C-term